MDNNNYSHDCLSLTYVQARSRSDFSLIVYQQCSFYNIFWPNFFYTFCTTYIVCTQSAVALAVIIITCVYRLTWTCTEVIIITFYCDPSPQLGELLTWQFPIVCECVTIVCGKLHLWFLVFMSIAHATLMWSLILEYCYKFKLFLGFIHCVRYL